jgi:hypothetical protein
MMTALWTRRGMNQADLGGVRFLNPFTPHFDLAQVFA